MKKQASVEMWSEIGREKERADTTANRILLLVVGGGTSGDAWSCWSGYERPPKEVVGGTEGEGRVWEEI